MNSYRFLIIDDSKFTRQLLKEILVKQGHKVVAELDLSDDPVQGCREFAPDMIILSMPGAGEEGHEALRMIMDQDPQAAILVCCSGTQQEVIMSAVRSGARGYLLKPFSPEDVEECIGQHGAVRQAGQSKDAQWTMEAETPEEVDWTVTAGDGQEETAEALTTEPELAEQAFIIPSLERPTEERIAVEPEVILQEPVRMEISDIPAAVRPDSPKRLAETLHSDNGISFQRKANKTTGMPLTSHDDDGAEQVRQEPEAEAEEEVAIPIDIDKAEAFSVEEIKTDSVPAAAIVEEENDQDTVKEEDAEIYMRQEELDMIEELGAVEVQSGEESGEKDMGNEFGKMNQVLEQIQQMIGQLPAGIRQGMLASEQQEHAAALISLEPQGESETTMLGFMRLQGDTGYQQAARKKMTRTHMCNWNEDIDGESKQYLVVCTEGENKLNIEMGSLNKKQTLTFSLDGFFELVDWLEETIGRTAASRK